MRDDRASGKPQGVAGPWAELTLAGRPKGSLAVKAREQRARDELAVAVWSSGT